MPALIVQMTNNQWFVAVANTNIRYNFLGNTLAVQTQNVQRFAANMEYNGADLGEFNAAIGQAIDLNGVNADIVTQQLYATTDQILYTDRIIYGTVGEEMLIDDLVEAGEIFCLVLGM